MSGSVRISRRTAAYVLEVLEQEQAVEMGIRVGQAIAELRAAMAPKKSVRLAHKRVAAKKRTKRAETKDVWTAVMDRALGACEACQAQAGPKLQLDHFFGRVRVPQSERNCFALCPACHREKTDNVPSAAHWLEKFVAHAERHGFTEEAGMATRRLAAIQIQQSIPKESHA